MKSTAKAKFRIAYFSIACIYFFLFLCATFAYPTASLDAMRKQMVSVQLKERGISDGRVLDVMEKVPRHLFLPSELQDSAYEDRPLPIGYGQTISQPYIVAFMTEVARVKRSDRVLEIGTGSGYQAAILAELAAEVYTIEIVGPLANAASKRLVDLGYTNIKVKHGDGYKGWEERAPFDVILVTAAPEEIPENLTRQLAFGGRMVVPVGAYLQNLYLIEKDEFGKVKEKELIPVRFVPMVPEDARQGIF